MSRKDIQKKQVPMSVEEAQKEHASILSSQNDIETVIVEKKKVAETVTQESDVAQKKLQDLLDTIESKKAELASIQNDIDNLSAKKTTTLDEYRSAQNELNVLKINEQSVIEDTRIKQQSVIDSFISPINDKKNELAKVSEELASELQSVSDLKKTTTDFQERTDQLGKLKSDYEISIIPGLQKKEQDLSKEIALLTQESNTQSDVLRELLIKNESINHVRQTLNDLIVEKDITTNNLVELHKTFDARMKVLNDKATENEAVSKAIDSKIAEYKRMTTRAETESVITEKINEST